MNRAPLIAASKSRTSFLSLSAELRLRIYELALLPEPSTVKGYDDDAVLTLNPHADVHVKTASTSSSTAVQPALTRLNHQIRHETLPVFYGQKTFAVLSGTGTNIVDANGNRNWTYYLAEALPWLKAIGPKNIRDITEFEIRHQSVHPNPDFVQRGELVECFWLDLERFLKTEGIEIAVKRVYMMGRCCIVGSSKPHNWRDILVSGHCPDPWGQLWWCL